MPNTWEEFAALAASKGGRIVSSNDLHPLQMAELRQTGAFFVDPATSYGWGLLPWDLTTAKDEERIEKRRQRDIAEVGTLC